MIRLEKTLLAAAAVLAWGHPSLWAGLRTPMGEVVLDNIPIGEEINLREISNIPYKVVNTGNSPIRLQLGVSGRDPGEYVKPGYEKIPDTGWIRLTRNEFRLAPGEEALSDIILQIPKEDIHLGKKYQVYVWAASLPVDEASGVQIGAGLKSRLLINVAPNPLTRAQRKKVQELQASLGFQMLPDRIELSGVDLGKAINVKKSFKKSFKLINPNDQTLKFKIRAIPRRQTYIQLPGGWEDPPDTAGQVRTEPEEISLEGNSISEIKVHLKLPDEKQFRGKKFLYVIKAEIENYEVPVAYNGRLFIETK